MEGRIKSKSESALSTVDAVHEAIRLRCKMDFAYRKIGVDGKPYETRGGKKHEVTPVGVSYDDGFYYLTAWNESHGNLTEYRIDRMARVRVLEDAPATRNDEIARYRHNDSKGVMFGRFNGAEVVAELAVDEGKVAGESEARVRVKVCKSQQFYGWIASMGKTVRIVGPKSLVEEYRNYLRSLLEE